jgi:chemotaxis response regulator CheB
MKVRLQLLTCDRCHLMHEVTQDLLVDPNHVYVIPPNTTLSIAQEF